MAAGSDFSINHVNKALVEVLSKPITSESYAKICAQLIANHGMKVAAIVSLSNGYQKLLAVSGLSEQRAGKLREVIQGSPATVAAPLELCDFLKPIRPGLFRHYSIESQKRHLGYIYLFTDMSGLEPYEWVLDILRARLADTFLCHEKESQFISIGQELDVSNSALRQLNHYKANYKGASLYSHYLKLGNEFFRTSHAYLLEYKNNKTIVREKETSGRKKISLKDGLPPSVRKKLLSEPTVIEYGMKAEYNSKLDICLVLTLFDTSQKPLGKLCFFGSEDVAFRPFLLEVLFAMADTLSTEMVRQRAERALLALKERQDADYFLAANILNPLNRVELGSVKVQAEMLVEQKKQVQHKGRLFGIGGDLCSAVSFDLQSGSYVAFINCDAMGKSMQGALGAIIIGSVFEATITRTRSTLELKKLTAGQWLEALYTDLNQVLISLEKRMLVSAVLGIIDTQNGNLHYINAEHPPVIRHNDEATTFLTPANTAHRLGIFVPESIAINEATLNPGDSILMGSDGSDELRSFISNSVVFDNNRVLTLARETGADLPAMFSALQVAGSVVDDVSFLKVTYVGKPKEQFSQKQEPGVHKSTLNIY